MSHWEGDGVDFLEGGCHCGAVRFRVRAAREIDVLDCNCSICARTGYLHLIVPQADFELLSGLADLTEYRSNTGSARHLFCRICGIKSFYVPRSHPQGISVNARCLDPGSAQRMTVRPFNGRDWEQARAELQD